MSAPNRDSQNQNRENTGENAAKTGENTPKQAADINLSGELAGDGTKGTEANVPRYAPGYPHIETPSHHLWEDQQAGWPKLQPYEAWQAMVKAYNEETKPKVSSAAHPAFSAKYAPNYVATPEISEAYREQRHGGKPRR